MQIGERIKKYRKLYNFSQEELADKIFVSRQTISNWETNKTYPDIQVIITLSILFNISIDELVKVDLEEMRLKIINRKMLKQSDLYAKLMIIFTVLTAASISLFVLFPHSYLIIFVPIILYLPVLWSSFKLEKFKKNADLQTFSEILAFSKNQRIDILNKESIPRNGIQETFIKISIIAGYSITTMAITLLSIAFVQWLR